MKAITFSSFLLPLIALSTVMTSTNAFSLSMISSPKKASSSTIISRTKLSYARSNDPFSSVTLDRPPTTTTTTTRHANIIKKTMNPKEEDPIQAIAFLDDPNRCYKKSNRPRTLSEIEKRRRAFEETIAKIQAEKQARQGQEQLTA